MAADQLDMPDNAHIPEASKTQNNNVGELHQSGHGHRQKGQHSVANGHHILRIRWNIPILITPKLAKAKEVVRNTTSR